MNDEKRIEETATLFRSLLQKEAATPMLKTAMDGGGETAQQITTPHPYYVIDGYQLLQGTFTGAERMAGYQSIVLQNETPVEVLTASQSGETMSYAAAWPAEAAEALVRAMQVTEDNGIADQDFAVATVPEVGLTAVWFRERHELIPLPIGMARPNTIDAGRLYSESEIVDLLRPALEARFAPTFEEAATAEGPMRPPRA